MTSRDADLLAPAAARGGRGVPSGGDGRARGRPVGRDRRTPRTTTSAPRCCWPRCTRPGVRRLVLAGSMVVYGEGRYDCPEHGPVRPGRAAAAADLDAGRYEPRCPACGRELVPGLVGEDAPIDPRSTYAATKLAQEHLAGAWARQTGGTVWSLRYHNVYGPRMPRDTPYAGRRVDLPVGPGARRGRRGCWRTAGSAATSCTSRDVAAANALALAADPPAAGLTAVNVCSGRTAHGRRAGRASSPRRWVGRRRWSSAGARPGDVRHVVADPARAARAARVHAPPPGSPTGCAAFATDPLRAPRHRSVRARGAASARRSRPWTTPH